MDVTQRHWWKHIAVMVAGAVLGALAEHFLRVSFIEEAHKLLTRLPGMGVLYVVLVRWIADAFPVDIAKAVSGPLTGALVGFFLTPYPPVRTIID